MGFEGFDKIQTIWSQDVWLGELENGDKGRKLGSGAFGGKSCLSLSNVETLGREVVPLG